MSEAQAVKLAPSTPTVGVVNRPDQRSRRRKIRHIAIALSFVLVVVLPFAVSATYLFTVASDQYHSDSAFAVRSEEAPNPFDVIGAFTQTGSSTSPDAEILFDYIQSQTLIKAIDEELDLRSIYNLPERDPFFTFGQDRSVEDLVSYWQRMVKASIDSSTGVLAFQVRAFRAEDAQKIAQSIIERSAVLVENLSRVARDDAMRFTVQDVEKAEERLKEMRRRIREFRTQYRIIDPEADVESQVGIISALQSSLAEALIEIETIRSYSGVEDRRLPSIQRRIDAIRKQISNERDTVSDESPDGKSLSDIYGEYEELLVDLEFSQNAYTASLAAEETARIEANRRSRYLAVHIPPTLAEKSLFPQRELILLVLLACSIAAWGILVMIYYNIRDRR